MKKSEKQLFYILSKFCYTVRAMLLDREKRLEIIFACSGNQPEHADIISRSTFTNIIGWEIFEGKY